MKALNKYGELTLNSFKDNKLKYFGYWQKYVTIDIKRERFCSHIMASYIDMHKTNKIFNRIKEVQIANNNKYKCI